MRAPAIDDTSVNPYQEPKATPVLPNAVGDRGTLVRDVSLNTGDDKGYSKRSCSADVPVDPDYANPIASQNEQATPVVVNPSTNHAIPSPPSSPTLPSASMMPSVPPAYPTSTVYDPACDMTNAVPSSRSVIPITGMPAKSPPVLLRRSSRVVKQRMCYDPSTGGSASPSAVDETI